MADLQERWEFHSSRIPPEMDGAVALLRQLRETAPVHRFGPEILVTRFRDVAAIHRNATAFSSRAGIGSVAERIRATLTGADLEGYDELQAFRRLLMAMEDDPQHKRLRGLAHRAFTPRRMAALRPDVEAYMDELLDEVAESGSFDISVIAYRLPLMVIGDLLDVPLDHRAQMHEWTQVFAENEQEAPLTPVELAGMFVQLMVAGHETTAHLVGRGIYELMRAPDQWASFCRDPTGLAANTAEELLRVVSPLQWQTRVPLEHTTVAGMEILAGTTIRTVIAAANRDPEVFPDPDTLDLRRENARAHLAFGAGPHFCLGASLARMEGEIAFRSLAQRFPRMEAVDGTAIWSGKPELPALSRLTVTV